MSLLIGMDEAGYGPNLGPLVITASVWEVPDDPDFDIWSAMLDIVQREPVKNERKIQVGDSKDVYSPTRGISELEKSVQCALRLLDIRPGDFRDLADFLCPEVEMADEPWFDEVNLELPVSDVAVSEIDEIGDAWQEACRKHGIKLKQVRSDIVLTSRFNQAVEDCGSKGVMLSRTSLNLLRSVWNPDEEQPTLIVCDKHGGRNRYNELLYDIMDGQMIFCVEESRARSAYRTGNATIQFSMKAESHFPVALSSMFCKYVRELSMELFNQFWQSHVEGLKATKGYPTDARRFRAEITEAQKHLEMPLSELWRNK